MDRDRLNRALDTITGAATLGFGVALGLLLAAALVIGLGDIVTHVGDW